MFAYNVRVLANLPVHAEESIYKEFVRSPMTAFLGLDMLIQVATSKTQDELPVEVDRVSLDIFRQVAQARLKAMVKHYDDLPDDWSKQNWRNWWSQHRSTWKPGQLAVHAKETKNMIEAIQKMYIGIAKRFDQSSKKA